MPTTALTNRDAANTRYLAARGLALTGGAVAESVLPLIVVVSLGGGSAAVGGVTALVLAVSLICRLPLASWVDRQRRQIRIQALSQLGAAAAVSLVPLLWAFGVLTYLTLLPCVVAIIVARTLVSTCGHATINYLVPVDWRVRAIGRLNSLGSVADIVGGSAGPALTRLLPAPVVMVVDAVMNIVSAGLVWQLRTVDQPSTDRNADESDDPQDGIVHIIGRVLTFSPVCFMWCAGIVGSIASPVVIVYLIKDLGIAPSLAGAMFSVGAVGGIAGGFAINRILGAIGMWPLLLVSTFFSLLGTTVFLLISEESPLVLVLAAVALFELLSAFAGTLLVAAVFGSLQVQTGHTSISRTMSVASVGMELLALPGIAIGSYVATEWSERAALIITAVGYLLLVLTAVPTVMLSALRGARNVKRT